MEKSYVQNEFAGVNSFVCPPFPHPNSLLDVLPVPSTVSADGLVVPSPVISPLTLSPASLPPTELMGKQSQSIRLGPSLQPPHRVPMRSMCSMRLRHLCR